MDYTVYSVTPIVLLPFLAFAINAFLVKRLPRVGAWISIGAMLGSSFCAVKIFRDFYSTFSPDYFIHKTFTWFDLSFGDTPFKVDMGIYIDSMTAIMLLMVTCVATLIHVFSHYYMHDDARYGRFFVYLSLFTSAMLGLVLADNLLAVFVFWELMGFCSYSLIGFYYEKEGAGNASLKAFMTTRVGDVFFLLGILAIWSVVGNVTFVDIYAAIANQQFDGVTAIGIPLATFAAVSLFMGTVGKSAQFPLQVWLPDAMFGPTPCSALIHAATMVAAGVYLALRCFPLMELGGITYAIAIIGGITAFGAASIALVQTDLKAVLAYSTISQLGYMVLGIGVGSYNAAFMHLITHAVFKACLFLSAGSVIHSLHDPFTHAHVQEMPRMGGLRKKMPWTFLAVLMCTLAIAGIPFFSGFVSKDRILGDALVLASVQPYYWIPTVLGFGGAFLTAFYMFRMVFLTFFGDPSDRELFDHIKPEKLQWNRNVPLLILSLFTLGLWYSGSATGQKLVKVPVVAKEWFALLVEKPNPEKFVNRSRQAFGATDDRPRPMLERAKYDPSYGLSPEEAHRVHRGHHIGALLSIIIALGGVLLAMAMYLLHYWNPRWWVNTFSLFCRILQNKYYMDDFYLKGVIQKALLPLNNFFAFLDMKIYDRFIIDGQQTVSRIFFTASKWFDDVMVDTVAVDGSGASVRFFNVILRMLQSGKIQFYFIMIILVLAGYVWTLNI